MVYFDFIIDRTMQIKLDRTRVTKSWHQFQRTHLNMLRSQVKTLQVVSLHGGGDITQTGESYFSTAQAVFSKLFKAKENEA